MIKKLLILFVFASNSHAFEDEGLLIKDSKAHETIKIALTEEQRLKIIKEMTVDQMRRALLVCSGTNIYKCEKQFLEKKGDD